jgi:hypothetical protein
MQNKTQLSIIIGLIVVKLLLSIINSFVFFESVYTNDGLFLFHRLADIVLILYVYKFVKIDKKQNVSIIPAIIIGIMMLYFCAIRFSFFEIVTITDSSYTNRLLMHSVIPSLIQLINELIIGMQLIQNKIEDGSRDSIRLVGFSFFFVLIPVIAYPIIMLSEVSGGIYIVKILTLVPLFAMLYMYGTELKRKY